MHFLGSQTQHQAKNSDCAGENWVTSFLYIHIDIKLILNSNIPTTTHLTEPSMRLMRRRRPDRFDACVMSLISSTHQIIGRHLTQFFPFQDRFLHWLRLHEIRLD